ncbi:MAG TPA: YeeE/YedE thiosulfate transporter family protein [Thermoanaerobaculia bacterium]
MKYADPYIAGVGLGLVLLASFAFTGRGLGASGAFAGDPWLLCELGGVIAGGFLSALIARRLTLVITRGPRMSSRSRLVTASIGGAIMGVGAVLARGCTSGLALTGGALLAVGSWLFIIAAFAAAYLAAPFLRKAWQ